MRANRKLRVVKSDPEPPKDITGLLRADIAKRDWARVHIAADRRAPIAIGERRPWRYL